MTDEARKELAKGLDAMTNLAQLAGLAPAEVAHMTASRGQVIMDEVEAAPSEDHPPPTE